MTTRLSRRRPATGGQMRVTGPSGGSEANSISRSAAFPVGRREPAVRAGPERPSAAGLLIRVAEGRRMRESRLPTNRDFTLSLRKEYS
jgi:hypothetical protein